MADDTSINAMVAALGKNKGDFVAEVSMSVNSYISGKTWQECLTIVERYSDGTVRSTWRPAVNNDYSERLMKFLRRKTCNGYALDSYLTDGVVRIVTGKFEKFYSNNAAILAEPLLKKLMKDDNFVDKIATQIINSSTKPLTDAVKKQLMHKFVGVLKNSMQNVAVESFQNLAHQIVAEAASVPISQTVIMVVLHNMTIFLHGAIAKIMATTAFKTVFAAAVKKFVAAKVIAILITILGPTFGSIPLVCFLAPILAAFIAYEVSTLPDNMGEKISSAVAEELGGEFDKLNGTVVTQILNSLTPAVVNDLISNIAAELAQNIKIRSEFDENIAA